MTEANFVKIGAALAIAIPLWLIAWHLSSIDRTLRLDSRLRAMERLMAPIERPGAMTNDNNQEECDVS